MWADLLNDAALAFPWPYDPTEIEALVAGFREDERSVGAHEIVAVARRCLAAQRAKARRLRKANPASELTKLATEVKNLTAHLESLSPKALQSLRGAVSTDLALDADPMSLLRALYAFQLFNPALIQEGEPPNKGGRPAEALRKWVLDEANRIFDARQERPTRGRPTYLKRVTARLGFPIVADDTMRRTRDRSTVQKHRPEK